MQIVTQRDQSQPSPVAVPKRRILCATDLSLRSERAMRRAALLARQMNAEVHFVHAVSDRLSGRILRAKVNRAYALLLSQSERLVRHAPENVTTAVRLGKPLDVLIAEAREYQPDLIVMARPNRRRLDAITGTTAERMIRGGGCSVLLVAGSSEGPYKRVVLATDASSTSTHVIRTVQDMGMLEHAYAWVVHAFGMPYHHIVTSDSFHTYEDLLLQTEWNSAARRDVIESLDDAGIDLTRVHITTEQAQPLTAIQRSIDQVQPQLLVIGVSRWLALKRILAGSVADQVFRTVNCDVLAIAPSSAAKMWDSLRSPVLSGGARREVAGAAHRQA